MESRCETSGFCEAIFPIAASFILSIKLIGFSFECGLFCWSDRGWGLFQFRFPAPAAGRMNSLFCCDAERMNKEVHHGFFRRSDFFTAVCLSLIRLRYAPERSARKSQKKTTTEEEGDWSLRETGKG